MSKSKNTNKIKTFFLSFTCVKLKQKTLSISSIKDVKPNYLIVFCRILWMNEAVLWKAYVITEGEWIDGGAKIMPSFFSIWTKWYRTFSFPAVTLQWTKWMQKNELLPITKMNILNILAKQNVGNFSKKCTCYIGHIKSTATSLAILKCIKMGRKKT